MFTLTSLYEMLQGHISRSMNTEKERIVVTVWSATVVIQKASLRFQSDASLKRILLQEQVGSISGKTVQGVVSNEMFSLLWLVKCSKKSRGHQRRKNVQDGINYG